MLGYMAYVYNSHIASSCSHIPRGVNQLYNSIRSEERVNVYSVHAARWTRKGIFGSGLVFRGDLLNVERG